MKVTVVTQAFNPGKFIHKCISSVLNQTYKDIEYIFLDNGCTDGSQEVIAEYAEKDKRMRLIKFEKNREMTLWPEYVLKYGTGEYIASLDADDWWELDYLERLIGFLEKNDLDLAVTGTVVFYEESQSSHIMRKLDEPAIFTIRQFAEQYPEFWVFPSTIWASVMKMSIFKQLDSDILLALKNSYYGGDTLFMLEYIDRCRMIGIDSSALQHYRIHNKSVSYRYSPRRCDSTVLYYEGIKKFLEKYNAFGAFEQHWLKRVYINGIISTFDLLSGSNLSKIEKLRECARISAYPLTRYALTADCDEREQWFKLARSVVFSSLSEGDQLTEDETQNIFSLLTPSCCRGIRPTELPLYSSEPVLLDALMRDDKEAFENILLEMIKKGRNIKKFDLPAILIALSPAASLLGLSSDVAFFRKYGDIYKSVARSDFSRTFTDITNILLDEKIGGRADEQLIELYISLSDSLKQPTALAFGKIRLAELYLKQGRKDECGSLINELEKMGKGTDNMVIALKNTLGEQP